MDRVNQVESSKLLAHAEYCEKLAAAELADIRSMQYLRIPILIQAEVANSNEAQQQSNDAAYAFVLLSHARCCGWRPLNPIGAADLAWPGVVPTTEQPPALMDCDSRNRQRINRAAQLRNSITSERFAERKEAPVFLCL
jgi:hypothetical protein